MPRRDKKKKPEVIIVMREGQIFRGIAESLTTEGIILDGYCSRFCFVDMISCRCFKAEVDYLKPWKEPTHILMTLIGDLVLRGDFQECDDLLNTYHKNLKAGYKLMCAIPSKGGEV